LHCELIQIDWKRFYLPDVLAVFTHRPVRRKLTHPGHIEYGHSIPVVLVQISLAYPFLTVNIRLIVGKEHILIVIHQRINERFEQLSITLRE
jgi:hypothetical protein